PGRLRLGLPRLSSHARRPAAEPRAGGGAAPERRPVDVLGPATGGCTAARGAALGRARAPGPRLGRGPWGMPRQARQPEPQAPGSRAGAPRLTTFDIEWDADLIPPPGLRRHSTMAGRHRRPATVAPAGALRYDLTTMKVSISYCKV
ncbi:MAG: hypothetical protein OXG35_30510, partial [Acidobacteria bacterium]|nr:hypothetical protein [Acidobacteriota bacterium]